MLWWFVLPLINYYFVSIVGLLSWDETSCHVDLASELDTITNACPPGEESRGGNIQENILIFYRRYYFEILKHIF